MRNLYMICFDVSDERRLRKISKELCNFGVRVQHSVFECYLDEKLFKKLQARLGKLMDSTEDQVRYYPICPRDAGMILLNGPVGLSYDPEYILL